MKEIAFSILAIPVRRYKKNSGYVEHDLFMQCLDRQILYRFNRVAFLQFMDGRINKRGFFSRGNHFTTYMTAIEEPELILQLTLFDGKTVTGIGFLVPPDSEIIIDSRYYDKSLRKHIQPECIVYLLRYIQANMHLMRPESL